MFFIVSTPKHNNSVANFVVYNTEDRKKLINPDKYINEDYKDFITYFSNYFQIRVSSYVYTIFNQEKKNSVFIICTGISNSKKVQESITPLQQLFSLSKPIFKQVCTSSYHGFISISEKNVSFLYLLREYSKSPQQNLAFVSIQFHSTSFPGVTIRTESGGGTITLFNSGKYHIVGVTNPEKAIWLQSLLRRIIKHAITVTQV